MAKDIVQRLRDPWFTNGCEAYQLEAAREIERLRKIIDRAGALAMQNASAEHILSVLAES